MYCYHQTQTPRRPSHGWWDHSLCRGGICFSPWISPLDPEPRWGFLCCLCGVLDGVLLFSVMPDALEALYSDLLAKPLQPTSVGMYFCLPTLLPTVDEVFILGLLPLVGFLQTVPPQHCRLQNDDVLGGLWNQKNSLLQCSRSNVLRELQLFLKVHRELPAMSCCQVSWWLLGSCLWLFTSPHKGDWFPCWCFQLLVMTSGGPRAFVQLLRMCSQCLCLSIAGSWETPHCPSCRGLLGFMTSYTAWTRKLIHWGSACHRSVHVTSVFHVKRKYRIINAFMGLKTPIICSASLNRNSMGGNSRTLRFICLLLHLWRCFLSWKVLQLGKQEKFQLMLLATLQKLLYITAWQPCHSCYFLYKHSEKPQH